MKFIILFTLLGYCYCTNVPFTDCGSVDSVIQSVDITPCADPTFCELIKGQDATVTIVFKPNTQITSINVVVTGIINNVPVPFPLPNPNGCVMSGLTCPLSAGSTYTYTQSIPVESDYPTIPLVIQWELKDQTGKDTVCFLVPAYISS